MVAAIQLREGAIEAGTDCQARDRLSVGDWVVRCPECGSYTHQDCWVANDNTCPRQGCTGAGQVTKPAPTQVRIPLRQPFQMPSAYVSPLRATNSSTSLLNTFCGRDGGRFLAGDKVVRCPNCGTPYHEHCWAANNNRCSQPTCSGSAILWRSLATSSAPERPQGSLLTEEQRSELLEEEGCFEQILDVVFDVGGCVLKLVLIIVVIAVILFVLSSLGII